MRAALSTSGERGLLHSPSTGLRFGIRLGIGYWLGAVTAHKGGGGSDVEEKSSQFSHGDMSVSTAVQKNQTPNLSMLKLKIRPLFVSPYLEISLDNFNRLFL